MTLSLKSLNSAIEAMQAEVKATDDLSAKMAEATARLEKAEKRLDIQAAWDAELFNRTNAMAERVDTLEKRDAITEAVKDKAKAVPPKEVRKKKGEGLLFRVFLRDGKPQWQSFT